jgi:aminoglycoside 6'-N-acetyltransferase I
LLWPEASLEEHLKALDDALNNKTSGTLPSAILVSRDEHGVLLRFLKLASALTPTAATPTRPGGFVESWFVEEPFRNRGVGGELMRCAEDWARAQGALEMASDALIDNDESQRAQQALGFEGVDRCVHFRKGL